MYENGRIGGHALQGSATAKLPSKDMTAPIMWLALLLLSNKYYNSTKDKNEIKCACYVKNSTNFAGKCMDFHGYAHESCKQMRRKTDALEVTYDSAVGMHIDYWAYLLYCQPIDTYGAHNDAMSQQQTYA